MMILVRLWLLVSLSAGAPLNPQVDNEALQEDLVIDDNANVEIVKGEDILSDEFHSHNSQDKDRDAKDASFVFTAGDVSMTVHEMSFSGDQANFKVASFIFNDMPQYPNPTSQAVDGGWSNWSEYDDCSEKCGGGTQVRTRICDNPVPKHNGRTCEQQNIGHAEETRECNLKQCAIDGDWSSFGECTKTCVGGVRIRTCTNPTPQHGGKECTGDSSQPCNEGIDCAVDGGWSNWSEYDDCSEVCGGGTQVRTRTCSNPLPEHNGRTCEQQNIGHAEETRECNTQACVCSAGEITSNSCLCKSADDNKSEEECSDGQVCAEEGACYAVCPPGPYILQGDCFCKETNGGGKLCEEGYRCNNGECIDTDSENIKSPCDFDDNLLAPKVTVDGHLSPHDTSQLFKWTNNVVPYYYSDETATAGDKDLVRTAMDRIQEKTCFSFVDKTKDDCEGQHCLEIHIEDVRCSGGCSGSVAKKGPYGMILKLSLSAHITSDNGEDCGYQGLVTHELMHALGVAHTMRRSDRDEFISVKFGNLPSSSGTIADQYRICAQCKLYDSIPYDCGSIMHYGTHSFSRNGKEVIEPKNEEKCPLKRLANLFLFPDATAKDYELLKIIGNCAACNGPPTSTSFGSWTCDSDFTKCQVICTPGYTSVIHNTECVNGQWDVTISHICALNSNKVYFLAGGYNAQSNIELYHPTLGSTSCNSPPPQLDTTEKHKYWRRHTSFYHDNTIYLCGGDDQLSTCLSLNPSSASLWTAHTLPSPVGRGLSSLVFNDKVVFVGGKDFSGNVILATSMTLPLSTSPTLTLVPNLSYLGSSQCVAKLTTNSFIISGGYSNNSPLSTVLLYNLETESVSLLAPLSPPRDGLGCITVQEEGKVWLIVTGGWDDKEKAMATTQRLDIEANTWEDLGDLKEARSGHTMINSESRGIMVLGGLDGDNKEMDSVELLMNKEWKKIEPSLETSRDSFGGAVEISADLFSCQLDPKTESVYLLAGGYGAKREITLYDPSVSNLACSTPPPLLPLNKDWYRHSTFYHHNTIYLCGGYYTDSICISHTPGNGWKTHTLTTSRDQGHSTVVLQDSVYFIGGQDSYGNYRGAEYTALPLTDTPVLTPVPNLDYKGVYPCTGRIDQDTLVITGGYNKGVLSTVSIYNSRTGAFTKLPSLKQASMEHGCGVWEEGDNKWIIVAGGFNLNDGKLKTTEMLELGGSDSEWISMENLNVARDGHSMAVTERGVMVMGGKDASDNDLSSVELFDWNTKTWSIVESSLDKPRYLFGGAVKLPASMFGCTGMSKAEILNEKIKEFDETIKAIRELKIEMQSIEDELKPQDTRGEKSFILDYDTKSSEERRILHVLFEAINYLEGCSDSDICEANTILELKEKAIEIFSKIKHSGTINEQFKEEFYDVKLRLDAACSYAEEAQTAKKDEVAKQIEEVKAAKEDPGSNKHDLL